MRSISLMPNNEIFFQFISKINFCVIFPMLCFSLRYIYINKWTIFMTSISLVLFGVLEKKKQQQKKTTTKKQKKNKKKQKKTKKKKHLLIFVVDLFFMWNVSDMTCQSHLDIRIC